MEYCVYETRWGMSLTNLYTNYNNIEYVMKENSIMAMQQDAISGHFLLLHLQQQYLPFSFSPTIGSLSRLHLSALPCRPPLEAVQPVCKKWLIHHILQWQSWINRPYLKGNTWGLPLSSVLRKHFFRICCLFFWLIWRISACANQNESVPNICDL